jgi:1-acyl-sn-glycerol-3-phosphate acyltransferase
MFAAIVLFSTWIILGIPAALIGFSWTLIRRDVSLLYRMAMVIVSTGLRLARIRVEATREQPPHPAQCCIFLSNHISNLDPPVLFPLLPGRAAGFIKRSLTRIPVLGYGLKLAQFIPVDRDGNVESAAASVQYAQQVLASGAHIVSFVEGTRSRDGRLQPFKKGPFYVAMESGAPVIPVSIHGTESMMRKGSVRIFPGTAHVVFHAPLLPRNYSSREELMEATRVAIASGLPEWMRS